MWEVTSSSTVAWIFGGSSVDVTWVTGPTGAGKGRVWLPSTGLIVDVLWIFCCQIRRSRTREGGIEDRGPGAHGPNGPCIPDPAPPHRHGPTREPGVRRVRTRTPQVGRPPADGGVVNITDNRSAAVERLSLVLWRERELLEELHYRLEVEQLVLASGRSRWLAHATRDIDHLLSTIRETEVLRAVAADAAAAAFEHGRATSASPPSPRRPTSRGARSSPSTATPSSSSPTRSPARRLQQAPDLRRLPLRAGDAAVARRVGRRLRRRRLRDRRTAPQPPRGPEPVTWLAPSGRSTPRPARCATTSP